MSSSFTLNQGLCGLLNLGSTCYINAAVQCLLRCNKFRAWVLDDCSGCGASDCLTSAFRGLVHLMGMGSGRASTVSPRAFVQVLARHVGGRMDVRQQNDVHEFLALFVDRLSLCARPCAPPPAPPNTRARVFHTRAHEAWLRDHSERYTPAAGLLYGQLVNRIVCTACGGHGDVFGSFGAIMVGLGDESAPGNAHVHANANAHAHAHALGDLLNASLARETVPQRQCDVCMRRADGESCQMFYRLPEVLMVNIKRFDASLRPLRARVAVPPAVDLTRVCLDVTNPHVYDLVAIACHAGSLDGGHYYAVCLAGGEWFVVDDDVVRPLGPRGLDAADSTHFYVVFYQRSVPAATSKP